MLKMPERHKKLATFPQEKLDEIVERMAEEVEKTFKRACKNI
ncbi:aldehyde dehydrogenase [Clostridium botulinum CFSAN002367]|nr:aldehyde dehydrogenase [Clostridium botulinum CFSAN002367]